MVYKWLHNIQNTLIPGRCLLCQGPLKKKHSQFPGLCTNCTDDLPWNKTACRQCAIPMPWSGELLCGQCTKKAPPMVRTVAPLLYNDCTQHLVHKLKFTGKLAYADLLGNILADHLLQLPRNNLPEAIVPVPLHPTRQRERGFNQAHELARPVSLALQIPIDNQLIYRQHNTLQQSGLDVRQRRRNVRDAFRLTDRKLPLHIALVDDVMTTGQTARQLAMTCLKGGCRKVEVWICLRAGNISR